MSKHIVCVVCKPRFTVDNLKWAMEVCDIENRKGNKDTLIEVFMDWCLSPQPQDKVSISLAIFRI